MPRVSSISILRQMEQPVISIRKNTKVEALPKLIGESFAKLATYSQELGAMLADVPYVAYHDFMNMNGQGIDVEIGFPISKNLPPKDDIKPDKIKESDIIYCMYRGAYRDITETYNDMVKWINDNGYKSNGVAYEFYYNGNEFPESELLTKIIMPITIKN